jgi:hypothetical protein
MLIVLLIAGGLGVIAPSALFLRALWSAIPRSNADFEWLDV